MTLPRVRESNGERLDDREWRKEEEGGWTGSPSRRQLYRVFRESEYAFSKTGLKLLIHALNM
jgi:hypothetical protein